MLHIYQSWSKMFCVKINLNWIVILGSNIWPILLCFNDDLHWSQLVLNGRNYNPNIPLHLVVHFVGLIRNYGSIRSKRMVTTESVVEMPAMLNAFEITPHFLASSRFPSFAALFAITEKEALSLKMLFIIAISTIIEY